MISFLQAILNFIVTIGQFLLNTILSVLSLITFIPRAVTYLTQVSAYMPPFISAYILLGISLTIVLFIISLK